MNRRNVLTGLGGLSTSGGALFGTGAFTSVTATRSAEVNVFGADSGTSGLVDDASLTQGENIADTITSNGVNVLVDTYSTEVSISEELQLIYSPQIFRTLKYIAASEANT